MAQNDFHKPFRQRTRPPASPRRPVLLPALVSAAMLLATLATLWVAVVDDPDGGRTIAWATIRDAAPGATGSVAAGTPEKAAPQGIATADFGDRIALAMPPDAAAGETGGSLLEPSAFGPLPRISPEGRRPRDVYAGQTAPAPAGAPRVVLVVGGMGLSQTGTSSAIERLPPGVTLAFAPYGSSLQRWVDKARGEGHEVLLQVPLEPEGYPQENPGEHTLLVSADPRAGREDLHWALGRMTSYAGVMNYMGARFSGDDRALARLLGELGERGLFYLDDGSAPQSRASVVGEALQAPVLMADAILDRSRTAGAIERELAALEATARARGVAVGVASAFPISVETIASWAQAARKRGVAIVPASAALDD
jgi:polysaccharide deacetylase 2 family uncharacterized protein YibQ